MKETVEKLISKVGGEFHKAFGISGQDDDLRIKLYKEELDEYLDARTTEDKLDAVVDMLYIACGTMDLYKFKYRDVGYLHIKAFNDMDAYTDVHMFNYNAIIQSLLTETEFPTKLILEAFDIVHASNMSKLDENGKPVINGENGVFDERKPLKKVLKSKLFRDPDFSELLNRPVKEFYNVNK